MRSFNQTEGPDTVGESSSDHSSTEVAILTHVTKSSPVSLDDLIQLTPQFTWNQIFQAVDGMTRAGTILLRRRHFQYELLNRRSLTNKTNNPASPK